MYDLIAEYLNRKRSTRIYAQFFKGLPSISEGDFKLFCSKVRKNLLSERVQNKHPDEIELIRKDFEIFENNIKVKIATPEQFKNNSHEVILAVDDPVFKAKTNTEIDTDNDILEVKSMVEILLANLQKREYKKAWAKLSPKTKQNIPLNRFLELATPIFDPGTRNFFVLNLAKTVRGTITCEVLFEQKVIGPDSYSIYLNSLEMNPYLGHDSVQGKRAQEELHLHRSRLAHVMALAILYNPQNDFVLQVRPILDAIEDGEWVDLDADLHHIFHAADIDDSNIHNFLPLTESIFVKMHATFESEFHDDRWHPLLFSMRYMNGDMTAYRLYLKFPKIEILQRMIDEATK